MLQNKPFKNLLAALGEFFSEKNGTNIFFLQIFYKSELWAGQSKTSIFSTLN